MSVFCIILKTRISTMIIITISDISLTPFDRSPEVLTATSIALAFRIVSSTVIFVKLFFEEVQAKTMTQQVDGDH